MSARSLLLLLALSFLSPFHSLAHGQPAASRGGVVVDASGAPIADAVVSRIATGGEMTPVDRTTADGRFTLPAGLSGGERLRVERTPFVPVDLTIAQAGADTGGNGDLRIVMALATTPETVTVAAPLVDAT